MIVHGFVLAGGHSRRFGRDKASLDLGEGPLAARTAALLAAAGCGPVALVGPRATEAGLRALARPPVAVLIEPPAPHRHPLFGVAAGLGALPAGALGLFAPCDLPALRAEAIEALIQAGGPAVLRGRARGVQPLLCLLDARFAELALSLALAEAPARALVRGLSEISVSDDQLVNLNHPGGDEGEAKGRAVRG